MCNNANRMFMFLLGMVLLWGCCGVANAATPQIASRGDSSFAIDDSGRLWGWGSDISGKLGLGRLQQSSTPLIVGSGFSTIVTGADHAFALKSDNTLWAWGSNSLGQLWDGSMTNRSAPVKIGSGYSPIARSWCTS